MLRDARILLVPLVLAVSAAAPARSADRFYEGLLADGIAARLAGDAGRAAKLLRIACLGFLEEPPALGRCLTHLALAQAESDDREGFRETFLEIDEVERRFEGYSRAPALSAADRRLFESRARELVAPDELARSDRFRFLAAGSAEVETPVGGSPGGGPPAEESPPEGSPPTAPVAEPDLPLPEEVAVAIARAREARGDGDRETLEQELDRLRPLTVRYPEIRRLQHLAGELAYRLRRWQESRDYFERGGEIDPGEPALSFYFAIALYETGARDRAAAVLRDCLPNLRQDPFVEEYAAKILGPGPR